MKLFQFITIMLSLLFAGMSFADEGKPTPYEVGMTGVT